MLLSKRPLWRLSLAQGKFSLNQTGLKSFCVRMLVRMCWVTFALCLIRLVKFFFILMTVFFAVYLQVFLRCFGHPNSVGGPEWTGAAPSLIVLLWPLSWGKRIAPVKLSCITFSHAIHRAMQSYYILCLALSGRVTFRDANITNSDFAIAVLT